MPTLYPRTLRLELVGEDGRGVDLGKLSTKFEIDRNQVAFAKIGVFNLSEDTISRIDKEYRQIKIDAGYEGRRGTIFDGQVQSVNTTKDGADKLTTLYASEVLSDIDRGVSVSMGQGGTLHDLIRQAIGKFEGVSVDDQGFSGIENRVISGGWQDVDSAFKVMQRIARAYRFEWWVVGGAFRGRGVDRASSAGQVIEVSRETGMVGSPIASSQGIEVRTLLDPRIIPGVQIRVVAAAAELAVSDRTLQAPGGTLDRINSRDNHYRVQRLVNVGESRGQPWYTQAFGIPVRSEAS